MFQRTALLQSYCLALLRCARVWRQIADRELSGFGVSDATAYPLMFMARLGDGIRQSALADALGIEGPSLVRLLDQLGAARLVERREDPNDKRAKTLHLTARGVDLAERLAAQLDTVRVRVFAEVGDDAIWSALGVFAALESAAGSTGMPEAAAP